MRREDVAADERGRERHDADRHEQEQVQIEEPPVDALAVLEQGVVIHPDDADGEEAHEVSRIRRPQPHERTAQIARVGGYAQLEHEQRCGDREDAVTECFEPARPHRAQSERAGTNRHGGARGSAGTRLGPVFSRSFTSAPGGRH